jgi:hypothetical protein
MRFPAPVTAPSPATASRGDRTATTARRKPLRLALALTLGCAFAAVLGTGVAGHLPSAAVPAPDQPEVASSAPRAHRVVAAPFVHHALADTKSSRIARPAQPSSAQAAASRAAESRRVAGDNAIQAVTLGLPQRLFAAEDAGATPFQPSAAFRVALTESRRIALALPAPTALAAPATLVASVPVPPAEPAIAASVGEAPFQMAMLEPAALPAATMPEAVPGADLADIPVPRARPRHRMKDREATVASVAPARAAPASVSPARVSPARVALARLTAGRDNPARMDKREVAAPVLAYARPDAGDDAPAATSRSDVRPGRGVAIYDISAATVYMPNGEKLEAHSGLGSMRDDPSFVHKKMRGATPPHTYNLALRESLFHGVRAIRLHPVGGEKAIHNRNGLLAHTYMLGKGGDSNGCVSFKDYKRFLAAFDRGEVRKLVVVASLKNNPVGRFASIFR